MSTKTCKSCGQEFPLDNFYNSKSKKDGKFSKCKKCVNERNTKWRKSHQKEWNIITGNANKKLRIIKREEALIKISGNPPKCNRCGFSDIRILQIDHVDGGGQREADKFVTTYDFHKYILKAPLNEILEKYQVLCPNCNWIKRIEKGELASKEYLKKVRRQFRPKSLDERRLI